MSDTKLSEEWRSSFQCVVFVFVGGQRGLDDEGLSRDQLVERLLKANRIAWRSSSQDMQEKGGFVEKSSLKPKRSDQDAKDVKQAIFDEHVFSISCAPQEKDLP